MVTKIKTHNALKTLLRWAARGWHLFPCAPHTKTPLVKNWPNVASSEPTTIRQWAAKHTACNWAVTCGPKSGSWVLDTDGDKGRESLARLEAEHGKLPATLASRTGREDGGEHRWFQYPTDGEIRCSAHRLGAGLDVRASGGYVIIPPSIHPTGAAYTWRKPTQPIADAPAWLLQLVRDPMRPKQVTSADRSDRIPVGLRNVRLTSLAGARRRRGATHKQIEEFLREVNMRRCDPPLSDADVRRIAVSVARYEPVGGPDPLERAWQAAEEKTCHSNYHRFLELSRALQVSRPGEPIVLPLKRIGALMGLHWTTISAYRKKAVKDAVLLPISEQYVPHRYAGSYWFRGIPKGYN